MAKRTVIREGMEVEHRQINFVDTFTVNETFIECNKCMGGVKHKGCDPVGKWGRYAEISVVVLVEALKRVKR